MSEATIRSKIKGIMEGVTDVGVVLDSGGNFPASFKTSIGGASQIRGWEIVRRSTDANYKSSGEEESTHSYVIRGYLHITGGTNADKTLNMLIEDVRAAFRFNFQLDGLCEFAGSVAVRIVDTRFFLDIPFNYTELDLSVREWVS